MTVHPQSTKNRHTLIEMSEPCALLGLFVCVLWFFLIVVHEPSSTRVDHTREIVYPTRHQYASLDARLALSMNESVFALIPPIEFALTPKGCGVYRCELMDASPPTPTVYAMRCLDAMSGVALIVCDDRYTRNKRTRLQRVDYMNYTVLSHLIDCLQLEFSEITVSPSSEKLET